MTDCVATGRVIGIDEAGRGPLAGPLSVAGVSMQGGGRGAFVRGAFDSKKLSREERELWHKRLETLSQAGIITVAHTFVSARCIDKKGMGCALRDAVARVLDKLSACQTDRVLLDGSLFAPQTFSFQQTIIKGDEQEELIAAASIVAKVRRDAFMRGVSQRYPRYGFDQHKGYGTAFHREAIKRFGLCSEHRKSFCTTLDKGD